MVSQRGHGIADGALEADKIRYWLGASGTTASQQLWSPSLFLEGEGPGSAGQSVGETSMTPPVPATSTIVQQPPRLAFACVRARSQELRGATSWRPGRLCMSDVTRMPTTLLLAASLTHRSPGSSLNQVLPSTHGVWQHVQPRSGVVGTVVYLGGCAPGQRAPEGARGLPCVGF
jgi:hypothetical protein